jgi:HAT1-interacting factor 1
LSFSGDAEEGNESMEQEDKPVDLFAEAAKEVAAEDNNDDDEEDEDAEPEDDFNAAWEVLELARAIYDKGKDADDDVKLKLADTYIALGDVSLETGMCMIYPRPSCADGGDDTEKFDQAISDYRAGLTLKEELLPLSSRQLAEVYYKLSLVLDMTPGKLSDAIVHANKALESTEARLALLRDGLQRGSQTPAQAPAADSKGKGKAKWTGQALLKDSVDQMTRSQIEAEVKELSELREDLALKVCCH